MRTLTRAILIGIAGFFLTSSITMAQTLTSGNYVLSFPKLTGGSRGVQIAPTYGRAATVSANAPRPLVACGRCVDPVMQSAVSEFKIERNRGVPVPSQEVLI
jgi:hypothetical protein